jgi:hypothetical protein
LKSFALHLILHRLHSPLLQERSDRAAKKRALVDFNADDNQEGVMDSLLEALKTGTAFSRDQKRKRAARPAGGEIMAGHRQWPFVAMAICRYGL